MKTSHAVRALGLAILATLGGEAMATAFTYTIDASASGTYTNPTADNPFAFNNQVIEIVLAGDMGTVQSGNIPYVQGSNPMISWAIQPQLTSIEVKQDFFPDAIPSVFAAASPSDFQLASVSFGAYTPSNGGLVIPPLSEVGICGSGQGWSDCLSFASLAFGSSILGVDLVSSYSGAFPFALQSAGLSFATATGELISINSLENAHFAVAPVPEPSTYALYLAGLVFLGFALRGRSSGLPRTVSA